MAVANHFRSLPGVVASTDMRTSGHIFLKVDGDFTVGPCGAGEAAVGVLMNCPNVGEAVVVASIGDLAKVTSGAAIALGSMVASDANGKAVLAVSGDYIQGYILEASAALDVVTSVHLTMNGRLV